VTVTTSVAGAATAPDGTRYDPKKEVPRVHALRHTNHEQVERGEASAKREPVFGIISREKWRKVEAASQARQRVEQNLSDLSPTPDVMVRLPKGADDKSTRAIIVKHVTGVVHEKGNKRVISEPSYTPEELTEIVKARFPDTLTAKPDPSTHPASPIDQVPRPDSVKPVEGMPIDTTQIEVGQSDHSGGDDHYKYEYRNPGVPGGCYIDSDYPPGGASIGTLGTPATTTYGDQRLVTAGHVLGDANGTGDNVYQETEGDGSDTLGQIADWAVKHTVDFDAGLIGSLEFDTTYKFAADTGADDFKIHTIYGTRTKQWLCDNQGLNISKQGIGRPYESEQIGDIGSTYFESNHPEKGGDSGGPYWHTVNIDEAYMCGIHRGPATNSLYKSRATIMESIEKEYDIQV
jgi:hypothetical protein